MKVITADLDNLSVRGCWQGPGLQNSQDYFFAQMKVMSSAYRKINLEVFSFLYFLVMP